MEPLLVARDIASATVSPTGAVPGLSSRRKAGSSMSGRAPLSRKIRACASLTAQLLPVRSTACRGIGGLRGLPPARRALARAMLWRPHMKTIRYTLGGLLAFGALNAFAGGWYGLTGARGVPKEWLARSPFSDYFVPGLILFVVVGGALLAAAIAVFAAWRRARLLVLLASAIVLGWLIVQLSIIGYVSWMQPATAAVAVLILALALSLRPSAPPSQTRIEDAATAFLDQKRIAVTGVSRRPETHGGNVVYRRLRERGYQVFAVNPNTAEVEGDKAYPNLHAIPGGVGAVVIATRPETAEATMRECADLGITHVWMHRAFGAGSVSEAAAAFGREHGIQVIDGGCPCMFDPTADPGHKAMRFCLTLAGTVPRSV
jgi:predicted CoA-binding protein